MPQVIQLLWDCSRVDKLPQTRNPDMAREQRIHLTGNIFASVNKQYEGVSVRKWYKPDGENQIKVLKPGQPGVFLPLFTKININRVQTSTRKIFNVSHSRFPNMVLIFCLCNPNMALPINAKIFASHFHAFGEHHVLNAILILKIFNSPPSRDIGKWDQPAAKCMRKR